MNTTATRRSAPRVAGALALGLAAVIGRELVRSRPGENARLLDWERVRRRAHSSSGETGASHLEFTAVGLGKRYDAMLAELRPWLGEAITEPLPAAPFPTFKVLGRRAWIDVNIDLFRAMLDPLLKLQEKLPASALTDLGRGGISEYLGFMLGFLSRRVLGQYDPVLIAAPGPATPTSLYLVEPNIEAWEKRTTVSGDSLRQWLVLHEVTHAWEFEAHPWLRDHLNGLMRDLVAQRLLAEDSPGRLEVLRMLTIGARSQWKAMAQVQATMSLLEGFSNVIMRRVGAAHMKDYDAVDAEFNRRSGNRRAIERAFFKVTGMDMKMQQYVLGERFCDAVIAAVGMPGLARVWIRPENLPGLDEIRDPARWIRRMENVTSP